MTTDTEAVDAPEVAPVEEPRKRATRRPATSDHKPKAKKSKKPKVKTVEVKPAVVEKDEETGESKTVSPAEYGRQVTLHGVTVTVSDKALGDFQTTDDLTILGEAQDMGEQVDSDLMAQALSRIGPLLRRLVGFASSQEVLSALRRENAGELHFGHAFGFISELIDTLSPNS